SSSGTGHASGSASVRLRAEVEQDGARRVIVSLAELATSLELPALVFERERVEEFETIPQRDALGGRSQPRGRGHRRRVARVEALTWAKVPTPMADAPQNISYKPT